MCELGGSYILVDFLCRFIQLIYKCSFFCWRGCGSPLKKTWMAHFLNSNDKKAKNVLSVKGVKRINSESFCREDKLTLDFNATLCLLLLEL